MDLQFERKEGSITIKEDAISVVVSNVVKRTLDCKIKNIHYRVLGETNVIVITFADYVKPELLNLHTTEIERLLAYNLNTKSLVISLISSNNEN
ncbi:MAG: hypothetical protein LBC44_00265 [Mycoplasmataceae bacterium]|jgi:hypothetical protein|nr:hypothetical protein [Mycoplasmataceae bacterium]